MQIKSANFAAARLSNRIEKAHALDPEAKPTEIQDMMISEIRKQYRALLEKRGASMPLSGAIIEDVAMPAVTLATTEVDTVTGEILTFVSDQEGGSDTGNLLASSSEEPAELATPAATDLEPELGFMADLSAMLGVPSDTDLTSPKERNEQ